MHRIATAFEALLGYLYLYDKIKYINGVPTEPGSYTVFLRYGDEIQNYDQALVVIDASDYVFVFENDTYEITYGDNFTISNYTILDFEGNPVNIEIKEDSIRYRTDRESDYTVAVGLLDANPTQKISGNSADYDYLVDVCAETVDGKSVIGSVYLNVNERILSSNSIGEIIRSYQKGQSVSINSEPVIAEYYFDFTKYMLQYILCFTKNNDE